MNIQDLRERNERERKAREKFLKQHTTKRTEDLEQTEQRSKWKLEKREKAREIMEAYRNSPEYLEDQIEQHEARYKEYLKDHNQKTKEIKEQFDEYREKYGLPNVPTWKVLQTVVRKEGLGICQKYPNWVDFQITTENYVSVEDIKQMKGTVCVRMYGPHNYAFDTINAMYLFGLSMDVCYFNTYDRVEDLVWSYQNSPRDSGRSIDFYYHTSIHNPTLKYLGFLGVGKKEEISLDGLKLVPDTSLVKAGEVFYVEKFLDREEADELFDLLYDLEKFRFTKLYHYDQTTKKIIETENHRQSYWLGDHAQATGYTDHWVTNRDTGEKILVPTDYVTPYEFPMLVWELKERIEQAYGIEFNGCLVGLYDSPKQKIGYHSDSSKSMGPDPYIGSVSLGASRKFKLKPNKETRKITEERPIEVLLKNGDLVVMRQGANKNYLHAVMKDPDCNPDNVRINLTFRNYRYHPDEEKINANPW